mgnify:FL=1
MENSNTMKNSLFFKDEIPFAMRKEEASRILSKYPDRIPIIIERSEECSNDIPVVDKKKYLVPNDITTGQFTYIIRKRIELEPEKAIFLFAGEDYTIPPSSSLISEIYNNYKDEDGFLYFTYSGENTFG